MVRSINGIVGDFMANQQLFGEPHDVGMVTEQSSGRTTTPFGINYKVINVRFLESTIGGLSICSDY